MGPVSIRTARLTDAEQLLPLMESLGYPQNLEAFKKRCALFLNQANYGVAVAEKGDCIIGYIAWSTSLFFTSEKVCIPIENLTVDTWHRRKGIGKQLVAYMESFAKAFSPCVIDLTSNVKRAKDGTHAFYKSLGYINEGTLEKIYLRKEI
jgi:predicted N-acetyltransferase YhbS